MSLSLWLLLVATALFVFFFSVLPRILVQLFRVKDKFVRLDNGCSVLLSFTLGSELSFQFFRDRFFALHLGGCRVEVQALAAQTPTQGNQAHDSSTTLKKVPRPCTKDSTDSAAVKEPWRMRLRHLLHRAAFYMARHVSIHVSGMQVVLLSADGVGPARRLQVGPIEVRLRAELAQLAQKSGQVINFLRCTTVLSPVALCVEAGVNTSSGAGTKDTTWQACNPQDNIVLRGVRVQVSLSEDSLRWEQRGLSSVQDGTTIMQHIVGDMDVNVSWDGLQVSLDLPAVQSLLELVRCFQPSVSSAPKQQAAAATGSSNDDGGAVQQQLVMCSRVNVHVKSLDLTLRSHENSQSKSKGKGAPRLHGTYDCGVSVSKLSLSMSPHDASDVTALSSESKEVKEGGKGLRAVTVAALRGGFRQLVVGLHAKGTDVKQEDEKAEHVLRVVQTDDVGVSVDVFLPNAVSTAVLRRRYPEPAFLPPDALAHSSLYTPFLAVSEQWGAPALPPPPSLHVNCPDVTVRVLPQALHWAQAMQHSVHTLAEHLPPPPQPDTLTPARVQDSLCPPMANIGLRVGGLAAAVCSADKTVMAQMKSREFVTSLECVPQARVHERRQASASKDTETGRSTPTPVAGAVSPLQWVLWNRRVHFLVERVEFTCAVANPAHMLRRMSRGPSPQSEDHVIVVEGVNMEVLACGSGKAQAGTGTADAKADGAEDERVDSLSVEFMRAGMALWPTLAKGGVSSKYPVTPLADWTTEQVLQWLKTKRASREVMNCVQENSVNGAILSQTQQQLERDLGQILPQVKERAHLLAEVRLLRADIEDCSRGEKGTFVSTVLSTYRTVPKDCILEPAGVHVRFRAGFDHTTVVLSHTLATLASRLVVEFVKPLAPFLNRGVAANRGALSGGPKSNTLGNVTFENTLGFKFVCVTAPALSPGGSLQVVQCSTQNLTLNVAGSGSDSQDAISCSVKASDVAVYVFEHMTDSRACAGHKACLGGLSVPAVPPSTHTPLVSCECVYVLVDLSRQRTVIRVSETLRVSWRLHQQMVLFMVTQCWKRTALCVAACLQDVSGTSAGEDKQQEDSSSNMTLVVTIASVDVEAVLKASSRPVTLDDDKGEDNGASAPVPTVEPSWSAHSEVAIVHVHTQRIHSDGDLHKWDVQYGRVSMNSAEVLRWNTLVLFVRDGQLEEFDVDANFGRLSVVMEHEFYFGDVLQRLLTRWKAFKLWRRYQEQLQVEEQKDNTVGEPAGDSKTNSTHHGTRLRWDDVMHNTPEETVPEGIPVGDLVLTAQKLRVEFGDATECKNAAVNRWHSLPRAQKAAEVLRRRTYSFACVPGALPTYGTDAEDTGGSSFASSFTPGAMDDYTAEDTASIADLAAAHSSSTTAATDTAPPDVDSDDEVTAQEPRKRVQVGVKSGSTPKKKRWSKVAVAPGMDMDDAGKEDIMARLFLRRLSQDHGVAHLRESHNIHVQQQDLAEDVQKSSQVYHNVAVLKAEAVKFSLVLNSDPSLAKPSHLYSELKKLDSCHTTTPYRLLKHMAMQELWGRHLSLEGTRVLLTLRDFPLPVFSAGHLNLSGLFLMAQLDCPDRFAREQQETIDFCGVQTPGRSKRTSVVLRKGDAVPSKIYHRMTLTLGDSAISYGVCFQPALTVFSRSAGRFGTTSDPKEFVGGPLQWWDLLRYKFHGDTDVKWNRFVLRLLSTGNPYSTACLEVGARYLHISSMRSKLTLCAHEVMVSAVDIPGTAPTIAHVHRGRGSSQSHLRKRSNGTSKGKPEAQTMRPEFDDVRYPAHHGMLLEVALLRLRMDTAWTCAEGEPFSHYVHHHRCLLPGASPFWTTPTQARAAKGGAVTVTAPVAASAAAAAVTATSPSPMSPISPASPVSSASVSDSASPRRQRRGSVWSKRKGGGIEGPRIVLDGQSSSHGHEQAQDVGVQEAQNRGIMERFRSSSMRWSLRLALEPHFHRCSEHVGKDKDKDKDTTTGQSPSKGASPSATQVPHFTIRYDSLSWLWRVYLLYTDPPEALRGEPPLVLEGLGGIPQPTFGELLDFIRISVTSEKPRVELLHIGDAPFDDVDMGASLGLSGTTAEERSSKDEPTDNASSTDTDSKPLGVLGLLVKASAWSFDTELLCKHVPVGSTGAAPPPPAGVTPTAAPTRLWTFQHTRSEAVETVARILLPTPKDNEQSGAAVVLQAMGSSVEHLPGHVLPDDMDSEFDDLQSPMTPSDSAQGINRRGSDVGVGMGVGGFGLRSNRNTSQSGEGQKAPEPTHWQNFMDHDGRFVSPFRTPMGGKGPGYFFEATVAFRTCHTVLETDPNRGSTRHTGPFPARPDSDGPAGDHWNTASGPSQFTRWEDSFWQHSTANTTNPTQQKGGGAGGEQLPSVAEQEQEQEQELQGDEEATRVGPSESNPSGRDPLPSLHSALPFPMTLRLPSHNADSAWKYMSDVMMDNVVQPTNSRQPSGAGVMELMMKGGHSRVGSRQSADYSRTGAMSSSRSNSGNQGKAHSSSLSLSEFPSSAMGSARPSLDSVTGNKCSSLPESEHFSAWLERRLNLSCDLILSVDVAPGGTGARDHDQLFPHIPLTPTKVGGSTSASGPASPTGSSPGRADFTFESSADANTGVELGAYRYMVRKLRLLWTMPIRREVNRWMTLWWRWWEEDDVEVDGEDIADLASPRMLPHSGSGAVSIPSAHLGPPHETQPARHNASPSLDLSSFGPDDEDDDDSKIPEMGRQGSAHYYASAPTHRFPKRSLTNSSTDRESASMDGLSEVDSPDATTTTAPSGEMMSLLEKVDAKGTLRILSSPHPKDQNKKGFFQQAHHRNDSEALTESLFEKLQASPHELSRPSGQHPQQQPQQGKAPTTSPASIGHSLEEPVELEGSCVRSFVVDFWRPQVNFQSNETNSRLVLSAARARVEGIGFPFFYSLAESLTEDLKAQHPSPSPPLSHDLPSAVRSSSKDRESSSSSRKLLPSPSHLARMGGSPTSPTSPRSPSSRYKNRLAKSTCIENALAPYTALRDPLVVGFFGMAFHRKETTATLIGASAFVAPLDIDTSQRALWVPDKVFQEYEQAQQGPDETSGAQEQTQRSTEDSKTASEDEWWNDPSLARSRTVSSGHIQIETGGTILRRIVQPCVLFFTYAYDVDMGTTIRQQAWAQAERNLQVTTQLTALDAQLQEHSIPTALSLDNDMQLDDSSLRLDGTVSPLSGVASTPGSRRNSVLGIPEHKGSRRSSMANLERFVRRASRTLTPRPQEHEPEQEMALDHDTTPAQVQDISALLAKRESVMSAWVNYAGQLETEFLRQLSLKTPSACTADDAGGSSGVGLGQTPLSAPVPPLPPPRPSRASNASPSIPSVVPESSSPPTVNVNLPTSAPPIPDRLLTTATKVFCPSLDAALDGREYTTLMNVIYYLLLAPTGEEEEEWVPPPPTDREEFTHLVEQVLPQVSRTGRNTSQLHHTVEYCVDRTRWEMKREGTDQVFVDIDLTSFSGRHEYMKDESRTSLLQCHHFIVNNRVPHKFKTLVQPSPKKWENRDERRGREMMLRLRTEITKPPSKLNPRLSTVTLWDIFEVTLFPTVICLPHDLYLLLWNYFFPSESVESSVDALLPSKSRFGGKNSGKILRAVVESKVDDKDVGDRAFSSSRRKAALSRQNTETNMSVQAVWDTATDTAAAAVTDMGDLMGWTSADRNPLQMVRKNSLTFTHYFKYCRVNSLEFRVSYDGFTDFIDSTKLHISPLTLNNTHLTWTEVFQKMQTHISSGVLSQWKQFFQSKSKRDEQDQTPLNRLYHKLITKKNKKREHARANSSATDPTEAHAQAAGHSQMAQAKDQAKTLMLFGKKGDLATVKGKMLLGGHTAYEESGIPVDTDGKGVRDADEPSGAPNNTTPE